jgi:hypothetical protein
VTLPRALERIGGIQAQYAPSMYIGLWSRVADFKRRQLTRTADQWLGPPRVSRDDAVDHVVGATSEVSVRRRPATSRPGPASRSPVSSRRSSGCRCDVSTEAGEHLLDLPRAPLPRSGYAGPAPLPPDLGRHAAGARPPDRHPSRATPAQGVQHQDAAVGPPRFWWMGSWPASGATTGGERALSHSRSSRHRRVASSPKRPNVSQRSTAEAGRLSRGPAPRVPWAQPCRISRPTAAISSAVFSWRSPAEEAPRTQW